ncbi:hypothetical protein [Stenoxybacter acetivorans]|uniref:hypothetical protein n=1 Tax=Stenoxybacter acetivorans TaxID=422441 RepID=UPI0012EBE4E5|nr:hypothetical protein [Stenoxybacter acetivorans]
MKLFIKILILCLLCFNLSGCMSSLIRFWNNDGWRPFPAKDKAYSECMDEARQKLGSSEPKDIYTNPDPQLHREHQAWLALYIQEVANCMGRKGYR